MKIVALFGLIGILGGPIASSGADWPQWGGTDARNMVSSEKGLPDWFDCGKENPASEIEPATTRNVKWVAELGAKTCGSPVVSHGKVFIGSAGPRGASLYCFDEQTGLELGVFVCPKPVKDNLVVRCMENWGVASTPTVDDGRVFFVSPYQEVLCLDLNTWIGPDHHTPALKDTLKTSSKCIVWKFDLAKELNSIQDHVASCSVLVHENFLYVCTGNGRWKNSKEGKPYFPLTPSLVVFNKNNGQLVARDDEQIGVRLWRGQWSSPSLGMVGNKAQIYFGGEGVCYAFQPVDATVSVPPDQWTTTTQCGPIIQFVDFKYAQRGVSNSVDSAAHIPLPPATSSPSISVETRYVIGNVPICSPLDVIPTAKVPNVPLLKKIWWFDCIPEEYKKMPFCGQGSRGDGKGRPCDITATPVFYQNRVYVAIGGDPNHGGSTCKGNLVCIDATKTGDVTKTGRIWNYANLNQSASTVAISGGLVYALDEARVLHCLDADNGQCYWTHSVGGGDFASPLLVDGKLFAGDCILSAGKELKLLGSHLPFSQYSTPCTANGVLFTVIGKRLWAICDKGDKKPINENPDLKE